MIGSAHVVGRPLANQYALPTTKSYTSQQYTTTGLDLSRSPGNVGNDSPWRDVHGARHMFFVVLSCREYLHQLGVACFQFVELEGAENTSVALTRTFADGA